MACSQNDSLLQFDGSKGGIAIMKNDGSVINQDSEGTVIDRTYNPKETFGYKFEGGRWNLVDDEKDEEITIVLSFPKSLCGK